MRRACESPPHILEITDQARDDRPIIMKFFVLSKTSERNLPGSKDGLAMK